MSAPSLFLAPRPLCHGYNWPWSATPVPLGPEAAPDTDTDTFTDTARDTDTGPPSPSGCSLPDGLGDSF